MKRLNFGYVVKMKIELTVDEVEFLFDLARNHYDATCRGVAIPGKDAFIHAAHLSHRNGSTVEEWSFREFDIARKILESAKYLGEPKDSFAVVLDGFFRSNQEAINKEYARLAEQHTK